MRIGLLAAAALLLLGSDGPCAPRPDPGRTVYALTADSTFSRGCFSPLACPIVLAEDLGGTFVLQLLSAGDLGDLYEVREVFWLARLGGEDIPITGSGSYLDGLVEDRLTLRLRVGDEASQVFDSGPVPSRPPGSREIAIVISIHGQTFFDTVIEVRALAFPPVEVKTPCGPSGLACDRETEVCVARTPVGPAIFYGCEPVPAGCETDRSCACAGAALCTGAFDTCRETGDNRIECECPECQ
jgi:hypothetical protein